MALRLPLASLTTLLLAAPLGAQLPAGTLIVTNKSAATASFIDLDSNRIVATVPTGQGPHEIALSRSGRVAVVTDYGGQGAGGNTLTVIDVPGRRVSRTIDLGPYRRPHGVAFALNCNAQTSVRGWRHHRARRSSRAARSRNGVEVSITCAA